MKRITAVLVLVAMVTGVLVSNVFSVPKPSLVSDKWELDFTYHEPKCLTVQVPGEDAPRTFWYIRYRVTNHTGSEQSFMPEFVLYTDTGQQLRAGEGVPSIVFQTIKQTYSDPLLKDQAAVIGRILRGADNAKDGVAIFRDIDPVAGSFDLFVGGLSGDYAIVKLPTPIEVKVRGKTVMRDEVVLSKTLHLNYKLPGEASARGRVAPELVSKGWVMR